MKEGVLQALDDFILDRLFQPVADRMPESMSAWSIGINFELGSVILQFACIAAPLALYGGSLSESVQSVLILLCSVVLFIGFQRFRPLVRPNTLNPLRPLMRSLRLVCLAFLVYETISVLVSPASPSMWLWNRLGLLSQLAFVTGLYFMACQPRPPGEERRTRTRLAELRGTVTDGI
ncbi:hypothetical protein NQF87_07560 [Bombella sp. TMW 2.2559]|uniref:Transmembrane protein n=1 Tax=Bombella dulcis TaxID=2967339 RepID=A0ABT3WJ28_9PROT|nr:hypothetical protein [Bombella dulcis]MCX5616826.1 hypothetical protein [Bombella dulcis]